MSNALCALPSVGQTFASIDLVAFEVGATCVDDKLGQVVHGHVNQELVFRQISLVNDFDFRDQGHLVDDVNVLCESLSIGLRGPEGVEDHVNRSVAGNFLLGDADLEFLHLTLIGVSLLKHIDDGLVDRWLRLDEHFLFKSTRESISTSIDSLNFESETDIGLDLSFDASISFLDKVRHGEGRHNDPSLELTLLLLVD